MKHKSCPPNQMSKSEALVTHTAIDQRVVSEEVYYSRQTALKEIAGTGQLRLKNAKLAMIGSGALGCAALPYLAAAGIGTIDIFDDDRIEMSNLSRQTLFRYKDIGKYKALVAAKSLNDHNPFIQVRGKTKRIISGNIDKLLEGYDLLVDGSDNLSAKYLLSDFSFAHRKPLISAGIYQFSGQIHVFSDFKGGCFRCFWPEEKGWPAPGINCSEAGILGSVAGIMGSIQAHEAIKIILGLPRLSDDTLFSINLIDDTYKKIKKFRREDCPCCASFVSSEANSTPLNTENDLSRPETQNYGFAQEFNLDIAGLRSLTNAVLVDIRDEEEAVPWSQQISIPFQTIPFWDTESFKKLPKGKTYVLLCQSGQKSKLLARELFLKFPEKRFLALNMGIKEVIKSLLQQ